MEFRIIATGLSPLTFQWQKDETNISDDARITGSTLATLAISNIAAGDEGSYRCIVTNTIGNAPSDPAILTVNQPGFLTVTPADNFTASGNEGGPFTFSPSSYSIFNQGDIPIDWNITTNASWIDTQPASGTLSAGETATVNISINASIANLFESGAQSGIINFISSSSGSTSRLASLTVNLLPPLIIQHPIPQNKNEGDEVQFSVIGAGRALTYQWKKNAINLSDDSQISGSSTNNLIISRIAEANAGNYQCVISNAAGAITSNAAHLTVNLIPFLVTQPVSQTVNPGSDVSFSITATGSEPLSFQWFKGTTELADDANISGANTATLSISAVTEADQANYKCEVSNIAGSATSNTASLSVNDPPAITNEPVSQTVNPGTNVSFSVTATGTAPISYEWFKDESILTDNANISGSKTATLSIFSAAKSDEGIYHCRINNITDLPVESAAATLTVTDAPVITVEPVSQTVNPGSDVSFSITATGSEPLSFQWFKGTTELADDANISGANTATLSISAVTEADQANYKCEVSNIAGSATSNTASLSVNDPPVIDHQPENLTVTEGASASFSVTATGSGTLSYQWLKNETIINGATSSTYNTPVTSMADHGAKFKCLIRNEAGETPSNDASLTVLLKPTAIINSPSNGTLINNVNPILDYTITNGEIANITLNEIDIPTRKGQTLTLLQDREYTLVATVKNETGYTVTDTSVFTLDSTKPSITVNGVTEGQIAQSVTPIITIEDINLNESEINLDYEPYSPNTPITTAGDHELFISADDLAGNSNTVTIHFTIDPNAPIIAITGVTDGQVTNQNLTIGVDISDTDPDPSKDIIKLDGENFTPGSTVSAEGNHELTVSATDLADNPALTTIHFTIDKTAPVVEITSPANNAVANTSTMTVSGTTSEPVKEVRIFLNSTVVRTVTQAAGTFSSFSETGIQLTAGQNILQAIAKDLAGNEGNTGPAYITYEAPNTETTTPNNQPYVIPLFPTSPTTPATSQDDSDIIPKGPSQNSPSKIEASLRSHSAANPLDRKGFVPDFASTSAFQQNQRNPLDFAQIGNNQGTAFIFISRSAYRNSATPINFIADLIQPKVKIDTTPSLEISHSGEIATDSKPKEKIQSEDNLRNADRNKQNEKQNFGILIKEVLRYFAELLQNFLKNES
ncbi:MAG: hypothetical protein A3J12_05905 [Omnitrophica bacterium RIFCSPLOWO2_02_FULL_44_11]|nr:MAG: hypothetical protein A3J12_05905 [Omnitrophica bacterium RIFCSPLOWO2_02_FULL_44_11]